MKKILLTYVCLSLFSLPAWADKEAKIKELIRISSGNQGQIEQILTQAMAPAETEILCEYSMSTAESKVVLKKLHNSINFQGIMSKFDESLVSFYAINFTEKEIDELLSFQKSSVGKKMVNIQPKLAQFMVQKQQEIVRDLMPKLMSFGTELDAKYQKRSQADYYQCMASKTKAK